MVRPAGLTCIFFRAHSCGVGKGQTLYKTASQLLKRLKEAYDPETLRPFPCEGNCPDHEGSSLGSSPICDASDLSGSLLCIYIPHTFMVSLKTHENILFTPSTCSMS